MTARWTRKAPLPSQNWDRVIDFQIDFVPFSLEKLTSEEEVDPNLEEVLTAEAEAPVESDFGLRVAMALQVVTGSVHVTIVALVTSV